ncbi:DUF3857 domain-containing transglutaminase family protein [Marivirga sp. S37H4]|uniref:DUF3857 domain-containing transglutaminase family protein n=1 Tax=Marivirga aurantiaca TaxID=2802615 RepID=A0A934WZF9_9BACT|nr:DUF3857 domain-containing transglutaminase family protein [Marivirga aurantiaca]MBK6265595.1 DUF3857 domain-containing transglutaminase family protein [Marivirga aurantiaca]
MKLTIYFVLLTLSLPSFANEDIYDSRKIPADLKKDAHAVFRLDEGVFEIQAVDKATYRVKQIITILNKKADHFAEVVVGYDKLIKVKSLNAVAFDEKGNQINKWKKNDFEDYSNISGSSLYEDNRVLYADLKQKDYPYTIEIEYELQFKYLYTIPDWYVIPGFHVAVEKSVYTISYTEDTSPRYNLKNTTIEPVKTVEKDITYLHWEFTNVNAEKPEIFSKGILAITPAIILSPTKFSFEGYAGDMSSWDGFARWQHSLNKGLNDLSAETRNEIKSLTDGLASEKEKVKAVYQYVQNRSRYVSVQLGIGGFQPFSASTVHNTGYGDCKGLTFYTQSLLEAIGINSYYSWIYAGEENQGLNPDFPTNKFNHVILFVPLENDTVWLECTSQKLPAGFLGSFTSDRYALVMTGEKADLIRTPTFRDGTNKVELKATLTLDMSGNADIEVSSHHLGLGTEYYSIDRYANENHNNQDKWVRRFIPLSDLQIKEFEFSEIKGDLPEVAFNSKVFARNVAKKVGDKYLLNPSLLNYETRRFKKEPDRKTNIDFPYDYIMEYELDIILPKGYKINNQLEDAEFKNQFGVFSTQYITTDDGINCKRIFKPNTGEYPADQIEDLWAFFDNIKQMENQRLMISKEE